MKYSLILCIALASPLYLHAANDLSSQMNVITKAAFSEVSVQMAVKINLAGKQRMLIQKMAKEALLISLAINPDENKIHLQESMALFEKTLHGLQKGDKSLDLTKTANTETLAQLDKVDKIWKDFKPAINTMLNEGDNKQALETINRMNITLLLAMDKAVSMYAENSGSNLNRLANVINLSGRQRMLTQKISKEILLIAKGVDSSKNQEKLLETTQLFDKNLNFLLKSDASSFDISKVKDEAIKKQLNTVNNLWIKVNKTMQDEKTDKMALQKICQMNLTVLTEMNKVVKMYEEESKTI